MPIGDATILLKFNEVDPDTKIKEEVTLTMNVHDLKIHEYFGVSVSRVDIRFTIRNDIIGKSREFDQHLSNLCDFYLNKRRTPVEIEIIDSKNSNIRMHSSGFIENVQTRRTLPGDITSLGYYSSAYPTMSLIERLDVLFVGTFPAIRESVKR